LRTEDGKFYAWGDGRQGQLGLGVIEHLQQPARAGGLELFGNQRLRRTAAGYHHLAVVADGAVYTSGDGIYGQLGLGDGQPRRRLTRVPQAAFAGSRVIVVSCGSYHTMALTAGHVWTCGRNVSGQLGVGDTTDRLVFTQVDAGQFGGARIVMAACGAVHSVVVSAEVRVWTFGYGGNGRLGHNDGKDRLVPTLLALFDDSKIVTVDAGGDHTVAVGEGVNSKMWFWTPFRHDNLLKCQKRTTLLRALSLSLSLSLACVLVLYIAGPLHSCSP
jgi:alpha-tubulin suppressor-like RCC1 family protein